MLIFSKKCLSCKNSISNINNIGVSLCYNCIFMLKFSKNSCLGCGEELKLDKKLDDISNPLYCGKCILSPFAFDQMRYMMVYDSHSSNFLKSYKFYHNFSYAKILIELLKNWISKQDEVFCINNKINHNIKKKIKKNISEKIDLIIPMPLHKLRLIKRGFNQTICFAKVLSEYFDTKLSLNLVKKVKSTKTQSRLDASKRRENLLGAFKVDKNKLKGVKRVLLVDDVMTTGSTAHILAKSLKKAGVQWVGVFVLLRAF